MAQGGAGPARHRVAQRALAASVLFADLPAPELEDLAARAETRRYAEKDVIVRRGDPGTHFFVVHTGEVTAELPSRGHGELALEELGPGDVFGEIALLESAPQEVDVVAVEPSEVVLVPRDDFLRFVELRPRVADRLVLMLRQELRRDQEALRTRSRTDVPGRLTRAIHLLAEEEGRAAPEVEILPVQLRREVISWFRPPAAPSWRVGSDAAVYPGDLVVQNLARAGASPKIAHSTSWRYEGEHLVVTYAAVVPEGTQSLAGLEVEPVKRQDLARGSATGPPDQIHVAQVVEHALRHLSWLSRDDPVVKEELRGAWVKALEGYEPQPFRALSAKEIVSGA